VLFRPDLPEQAVNNDHYQATCGRLLEPTTQTGDDLSIICRRQADPYPREAKQ
jgi:hypothetical protein